MKKKGGFEVLNKDAILAQVIETSCPNCANEFRKTLGELMSKDFVVLECDCPVGSTRDTRELQSTFQKFVEAINRFQDVSVLRKAVRKL